MKNSLITVSCIILILLSVEIIKAQAVYHVSPFGNDINPGTEQAPFKTIEKLCSVLKAGETGLIHTGIYTPIGTPSTSRPGCIAIETAGTAENRIKLWAAGDGPVKVDFSNVGTEAVLNRGFYFGLNSKYWHIKGLEICNAGDNGIKCEGSFIIFENLIIHNNHDTGLQIGMFKDWNQTPKPAWWPSGNPEFNPGYAFCRNNIVINCDSYFNRDSDEGDADGFAAKLFPGPGTEYHGCRAWNNADDNWDLYMVYHPIRINNSWCWKGGYREDGTASSGNGNGFKLGGGGTSGGAAFAQSVGAHVITNCVSFDNANKGFDQNNAYEGMYLFNCLAWSNLFNYRFSTLLEYGDMTLRNCIGFNPSTSAQNHEFYSTQNPDVKYCSWIDLDSCNLYKDKAKGSKLTKDYTAQFRNLNLSLAMSPRLLNGDLPDNDFAKLIEGSVFIDKGLVISDYTALAHLPVANQPVGYLPITGISIPFSGSTADMGAIEFGDPTIANIRLIEGSADQTVFNGTALKNIVFRYGGAATNVNIYNLPAGLSIIKDSINKTITISGTPTAGGTFTVSTIGGINVASASGTITLSTVDYAKLSSTNNTSQVVNIGSPIENIIFSWGGGATDVNWTVMPDGLNAQKDTSLKTLTITGIPTEDGIFSVSTIGGLGNINISVNITRVVPTRILTGGWYTIQDPLTNLPADLTGVVSITSGASYTTVWDTSYTESSKPSDFTPGAINVERGGSVMFTLPSLSELKFNMLTTGSRSVTIYFGTPGTPESGWTSTVIPSFAKGTFAAWDVMAKGSIAESKSPICVKFYNPTSNGGGIRIYDFIIKVFDESSVTSSQFVRPKTKYNLYQTESALIVQGDIKHLKIFNLNGKLVASSVKSQVVNTSGLRKGVYLVEILICNGESSVVKFFKK